LLVVACALVDADGSQADAATTAGEAEMPTRQKFAMVALAISVICAVLSVFAFWMDRAERRSHLDELQKRIEALQTKIDETKKRMEDARAQRGPQGADGKGAEPGR
jgi:fructoselysine-6-P-deglycase FrlB-like protein